MFSKVFLICAIVMTVAVLEGQAQPPTTGGICKPRTDCTADYPEECGRTKEGLCMRFKNLCEFQKTNCPPNKPAPIPRMYRRVNLKQCDKFKVGEKKKCLGN